jgi:hypothetical protein
MGGQSSENRIQRSEMILMGPGVYDQIVNIPHHIVYSFHHLLHEPLEGRRGRGEPHGHHFPLELSHSRYCEGRVRPRLRIECHLPEARSEIQGHDDPGSGPTYL